MRSTVRVQNITEADWLEIYYALHLKVQQIENGGYDNSYGEVHLLDSETSTWIEHLRGIMVKIETG